MYMQLRRIVERVYYACILLWCVLLLACFLTSKCLPPKVPVAIHSQFSAEQAIGTREVLPRISLYEEGYPPFFYQNISCPVISKLSTYTSGFKYDTSTLYTLHLRVFIVSRYTHHW